MMCVRSQVVLPTSSRHQQKLWDNQNDNESDVYCTSLYVYDTVKMVYLCIVMI